jgi:cephalosporin-C deacetylase-like acetyl esterase
MSQLFTRTLAIAVIATAFALHATAQAAYSVSLLTDREEAIYAVSEPVTFRIEVLHDGKPVTEGEVALELSNDGANILESTKRTLGSEPVTITGTLDHPGFLRCTATYTPPAGDKVVGLGAAGLDPVNIKPSMPVPDDFDAFWAAKKAKLAELPMNTRLTPVESSVAGINNFDVQLDCLGGAPVSGYYCVPEGAAPQSLPATLVVHGAGVRSSTLRPELAAEGLLVLDINAHGIPNGQPDAYYQELAKGRLKNYRTHGREDRETIYFLGMYYRLMRAIDFLTAQPEWDGKFLIVQGTSQGGGQSLVAAGLDSRVTAIAPGVPAMCDHTGVINGWPRLVPRDDAGNPDPKIQAVARYFDAMNFAARTKAEALVSVGFIDLTCRPTTVYAAYNNLQGEKKIFNMPLMGHKNAPEWDGMVLDMIKAHIQGS